MKNDNLFPSLSTGEIKRGCKVSKANWNYCGHSHVKGSIFEACSYGETFRSTFDMIKKGKCGSKFQIFNRSLLWNCSKMTRTRTHKNSSINYIEIDLFSGERKVWKTWEFSILPWENDRIANFMKKKSIQVLYKHWATHKHTKSVILSWLEGLRLYEASSSNPLTKAMMTFHPNPDGFVVVTRLWGWREKINPTLKTFGKVECSFEMVKWERPKFSYRFTQVERCGEFSRIFYCPCGKIM